MYDVSELKKIDDMVFNSIMVGGINTCLDEIESLVDNYGCISVEDLLDSLDKHHLIFTGVDVRRPRFTDRKYGWIDSDYFTCQPVKGGYKINIPWNQIVNLEEKEQAMPVYKEKAFPYWKYYTVYRDLRNKYDIQNIYFNAGKNTTVVVWATGQKTKVKLADGENCFINNAVAAAVMKRKYGSNSAFKARIDKLLGGYSDSAYLVLARAETSEIYGSYDNFDKLVKEKLILSSSK